MYISLGCYLATQQTWKAFVCKETGGCDLHTTALYIKLSREEAAQLHSQLEQYLSASAAPSICSKG